MSKTQGASLMMLSVAVRASAVPSISAQQAKARSTSSVDYAMVIGPADGRLCGRAGRNRLCRLKIVVARDLLTCRPLPVRRDDHFHEGTIMGMFDGLLGGIVGAGMVSVLNNIVEKHGGLQGVVNEFEKNGLGPTVKSWVGTGPNHPISSDDVQRTLGPDLLQQLSQKSGLSVQDLTQKLSQILPQAVDKLTPDGTIPKA